MKTIIRLALATITLAFAATTANAAAAKAALPTAEQTKAAITKLETAGVIPSADVAFWIENAAPGKKFPAAKLSALVKSASKKLGGPDDNLDKALDYLKSKKAITNTNPWKKLDAPNAQQVGGAASQIIVSLAKAFK